jgi:hypothetical protein
MRVFIVVIIFLISSCSTHFSIKKSVEISDLNTNDFHSLKNSIIHTDESYAIPWPGLMDSGVIQIKSFAWKRRYLDEKDGDIVSRFKTQLEALNLAQQAAYVIYLDIIYKKYRNRNILDVKEEVIEHKKYNFFVKEGIVIKESFDKYNRCEIVYQVPITGINDSKIKEKNQVDMKSLTKYAKSSSHKKYYVNESEQKEKWIDSNTVQINAFGKSRTSSRNRRESAKISALVLAQSRIIEIIKGVRLTKTNPYSLETCDTSGNLSKYIIKDIMYDNDDNCELTLIVKRSWVR